MKYGINNNLYDNLIIIIFILPKSKINTDFKNRLENTDPQLEEVIEEIMKELK